MKNDIKNKNNFDIRYFQNFLKELYLEINENRSFEDLYGYLDRTSGYFGKTILKGTDDKERFILPISWLFSICTKLEIDLQDAFLKKYPGICPYCLESNCVCFKTNKTPLKNIPPYKIKEEMYFRYESIKATIKVYNFSEAIKNILQVFSVNEVIWHFSGKWHHIAKIHEEIAEIHEAYGSYKINGKPLDAVAEEVADVFAWLLGVWGILYENESLDELFISYYYDGCPVCKSHKCRCGLYNSRVESLIDFKQVNIIKKQIAEISNSYAEDQELRDLIDSYDEIVRSQSIPSARTALTLTRDKLHNILLSNTNLNQNDIDARINSVISNINFLLKNEDAKPSKPIQYQVFFSYANSNREQAQNLVNLLEKNNITVFLSEKNILPMAKWENNIRDALRNSKVLFILASPDSIHSEWVTTEWGAAWAYEIPILPILYQCSVKELPDRLKAYQSIDFHEIEKIIQELKKLL